MITAKFKGYIKNSKASTTSTGKPIHFFGVRATTGKDKEGNTKYVYLNCKDMEHKNHKMGPLPEKDAFVTIEGSLDVSEYTSKEGQPKQSLDVFVHNLEVSAPKEPGGNNADLSWIDG